MTESFFEVETTEWDNDESNFCHVKITFLDGTTEEETFAQYCDDGNPHTAREQAASYLAALDETMRYTIEERLGEGGREFQREQAERYGGEAPF